MTIHDFSNRTLDNRYTLVRRIGYGGMATVYEGLDHQIDKRVAVKVLNPEFTLDEDHMARFRQEARAAAKIRHAHLVDVTDQGYTKDGLAYFVMEFLEGESLGEYIHRTAGPTPWELAVEIIAQVCDALDVAHARGIIHRDVKPGNCFLEQRKATGQVVFVKVLDLGIAKVRYDERDPRDPRAPPSTRDSQGVPGTPEYMAPEVARGQPYDSRVDIYAVGIVLYRLLTGELPFFSPASPFSTLEMHCNMAARPPRELNPTIPQWLERVVLTAMAKAPEERWASAGELATALRRGRQVNAEMWSAEEVRTQQYVRQPPVPTAARRLFFASSALGGLTTAAAMFLVLMLFEGPGQSAPPPARSAPKVTTVVEEPEARVAAEPAPEPAPEPVAVPEPKVAPEVVPAAEPVSPPRPETPSPEPDEDSPAADDPVVKAPVIKDPLTVDNAMFNASIGKRRAAISKACKDKIGLFENEARIVATVKLDELGALKGIVLDGKYAMDSVGKCVQAELGGLKFRPLKSNKRVFQTTITVKGKKPFSGSNFPGL